MLFPEEGTLHIDRITAEDQGLYTCKANNERGSVESSAHIWVQSKLQQLLTYAWISAGRYTGLNGKLVESYTQYEFF